MWRRIAVAATLGAVAACRPDMAAWRVQLTQPEIAHLDGSWAIAMRADSGEFGQQPAPAHVDGTLAFVLNRERVTTSMLGTPPVAFGTYDITLDTLGLATGDATGTPDAWVDVRGDSVLVTLSPRAKWPIALGGRWHGDSIVGRWRADQRAGPSGTGDFVLRRR